MGVQASEVIYEKLLQIEKLLNEVEEQVVFVEEDWEDRILEGDTLCTMYLLKQRFGDVYKSYDAAVWSNFEKPLTLANGATLQSLESTPRVSWDHRGLAKKVSERIVDESFDWETGEALRSHEEIVKELLNYVGVSYWKIKALKEAGIDPDQYSTPKEPVKSVKVIVPKG